MKERVLNNLGLKILSILLAFVVWLAVVNVSNPKVTRSKEITVEIENEAVLKKANKTYEIIGKNTVTVSYDVWMSDAGKIKTNDFRAYIDLADLYDVTGSVPVTVEVLNNKDLVSNVTAKPGVIRVKLEDVQRKKFELAVNTIGEPGDEYAVGSVTLEPQSIYVDGPVSVIGQISMVGVEIKTEGVTSDLIGIEEPVFYDANGNRLDLEGRVLTNVKDISYTAQILKVKNLAIDYSIEGEVASGYRLTGVESSVKAVTVVGAKSVLASVNTVSIPASQLNLEGASSSKSVVIDISQYLPPGVTLFDESKKDVTLVMHVEPLTTRKVKLDADAITKNGMNSQYSYQFAPREIEVTVGGLKDELSGLKTEDLHASVSLSGLTPGTHSIGIQFEPDTKYTVEGYTPVEVRVTEAPEGTAASTAASESSSEETEQRETTGANATVPGSTAASSSVPGPHIKDTEAAAEVTEPEAGPEPSG